VAKENPRQVRICLTLFRHKEKPNSTPVKMVLRQSSA
jgi:hypothetical protein